MSARSKSLRFPPAWTGTLPDRKMEVTDCNRPGAALH